VRRIMAGAAFIGSVVLANWMTAQWGQWELAGLLITAGTAAAGVTLVARDAAFEAGGRLFVFGLITAGAILSAWLSSPQLALASGVAFAASELIDTLVYEPVRNRRGAAAGVLASGCVSAPADSLIFLSLAPFPFLWAAVAGQVIVKVLISVAAALMLREREPEKVAA